LCIVFRDGEIGFHFRLLRLCELCVLVELADGVPLREIVELCRALNLRGGIVM